MLKRIRVALKHEKQLVMNVGSAFIIKGLSLILSMFSMPLYIKYFNNNEVLGVWYTILSLLTWINMCDLGLGSGLRNHLTEYLARRDYKSAERAISSTYAILSLIIIPIILVMCTIINCVDIKSAFGVTYEGIDNSVLQKTIIILLCGVGIHFILKTTNSVVYAMQLSSVNNLLSLIASLLPLLFISLYEGTDASMNLEVLSFVHAFSINIPLFVAGVVLFSTQTGRKCRPHVRSVSINMAKSMLTLGIKFFCAQVFFMFLISTNELFISRLYSPSEVVVYNIYYKAFMVIGSLFMIALTPIWSRVTKDYAEEKYERIKKTNRILYWISLLAVVAECCLAFVLQWVFNVWLGEQSIIAEFSKSMSFAFFGALYIFNIVLTTVANGLGELRTQIIFYGVGSIIKIPISIVLSNIGVDWIGIIIYMNIVLFLFCIFQLIWIERKINTLCQQAIK